MDESIKELKNTKTKKNTSLKIDFFKKSNKLITCL